MIPEEYTLVDAIKAAFALRQKPAYAAVIDPIFDPAKNRITAPEIIAAWEVVNNLMGKTIGARRENDVFDALRYGSFHTACFFVPIVVVSLIEHFDDSEQLYENLYYLLCNRPILSNDPVPFDVIDAFTPQEKSAVCRFVIWALGKLNDTDTREEYVELKKLWCEGLPAR